ncbi:MFS transporter [Micromonospora sp. M12]
MRLRRVAELAPDSAVDQNSQWRRHADATASIAQASLEDLAWADAYAFGTPSRFGAPAAQLKQFIDQAGGLWQEEAGQQAGDGFHLGVQPARRQRGHDPVAEQRLLPLGSLIVPPGFTDPVVSAAGGNPYGTSHVTSPNGAGPMPRRWKRPGTRGFGWPRSRSSCSGATSSPMRQWAAATAKAWSPREWRVGRRQVMTRASTATRRARLRTGSSWMVLALACACQFMVILDVSIVNVALPSVQRDLGFTATGLAWVVNGYVLTLAGFMLLGGRAVDLVGPRRMLVAGLLLFSASSLVGGLATAPEILVAARAAQGVGAAMLAPATLTVINTYFTEPRTRAGRSVRGPPPVVWAGWPVRSPAAPSPPACPGGGSSSSTYRSAPC